MTIVQPPSGHDLVELVEACPELCVVQAIVRSHDAEFVCASRDECGTNTGADLKKAR